MKVLITGASGLVGGRLFVYLKKKRVNVYPVSRKKLYYKKIEFKKIVWESHNNLKKLCKNIDVIIHCAGLNAQKCQKSYKNALKVNFFLTKKLFKIAESEKVKLFLFLSTAHVYSNSLTGTISESSKARGKHPYGLTNRKAENFLTKSKSKITKRIIIRASNLFGYPVFKKTNCWHLLINNLCKEIIEKNKLTIKSPKNEYRNFAGVETFCKFIFILINSFSKKKSYFPNIINYGSNYNLTLLKVAKTIRDRSKLILKRKIKLIVKNKELIRSKQLNYKSLFLKKIKFNSDKYFLNEIDWLLNYCKKNYKLTVK